MAKKQKLIRFPVDIHPEEVMDGLVVAMSHDELFKFIKGLDKHVSEWGFTEKLHKHFASEMKKLAEEEARFGV